MLVTAVQGGSGETTITTRQNILRTLERCLQDWGYRGELLRTNFTFGQADGASRTVSIAAFARLPTDARTSCIAVVEADRDVRETVGHCQELAAPIVFAVNDNGIEWWKQEMAGPVLLRTVDSGSLDSFARAYRETFEPLKLYRAKTQSLLDPQYKLPFIDAHLMPTVERSIGARLGHFIEDTFEEAKGQLVAPGQRLEPEPAHQLLRDIFWLLAAKILRDKGVPAFLNLDLTRTKEVLRRVSLHYGEPAQVTHANPQRVSQLKEAARAVSMLGHLGQVTTEALAYVYENTLVTAELRDTLGIHSTPPYLSDYVIGRMMPHIESLGVEERRVLEPACGHGAFLVAAMRALRDLLPSSVQDTHEYLKRNLYGVETDPTAMEIARLRLTLADIPNPNGWNLFGRDMFLGGILPKLASKSTIMLANPPFEAFDKETLARYDAAGYRPHYDNKAAEMLHLTLAHLPHHAVIGVIMPMPFLWSKGAAALRRVLVNDFSIDEILTLPDKVFSFAEAEAAVIIAKKKPRSSSTSLMYRVLREPDVDGFREGYRVSSERNVSQARFVPLEPEDAPVYELRLAELHDVWVRGEGHTLSNLAQIGLGFQHKSADTVKQWSDKRFPGAQRGYIRVGRSLMLHEQPKWFWVNVARDAVAVSRAGLKTGSPQLLVNRSPTGRGVWRTKAVIDPVGYVVKDAFTTVRPHPNVPLEFLWAICNSPYANAYISTHSTKRHIDVSLLAALPVPQAGDSEVEQIVQIVRQYIAHASKKGTAALWGPKDEMDCEGLMRRLDALILRLYDLPPRLERQVLKYLDGAERQGLPFRWDGFYPESSSEQVPYYVIMGRHDHHLRGLPAVELSVDPCKLHEQALTDEIRTCYAELAELDNLVDGGITYPSLRNRRSAIEHRLRSFQKEEVRRLIKKDANAAPAEPVVVSELLRKYGYTPPAHPAVRKRNRSSS